MDMTGLIKRLAVPEERPVPRELLYDDIRATAITRDDLADEPARERLGFDEVGEDGLWVPRQHAGDREPGTAGVGLSAGMFGWGHDGWSEEFCRPTARKHAHDRFCLTITGTGTRRVSCDRLPTPRLQAPP